MSWLELHTLPVALLAAAVVGAGVLFLARSPRLALVVLVGALYLNLADIVARHGVPNLIVVLSVPGFLAAIGFKEVRETVRQVGQPLTWILAGYLVVLLLSTTYAHDVGLAQERLVETGKAFVLFVIVLLLAASRDRLRLAAWTLLGCAAVLSVLAVAQVLTGDFSSDLAGFARFQRGETYGERFGNRVAGPLGDPNFFAQILVLVVPIGLFLGWRERRKRIRLLAFAAVAAVVGGVLLTYSRGGALALGLVVVLSLAGHGTSWRRIVAGAGALVVAAMLLAPSGFAQRLTTIRQLVLAEEVLDMDSSFQERIMLMRAAAEMVERNPVLGVGAGNYPTRYAEYAGYLGSAARDYEEPGADRYPHNLYLEVAAETGALGLLLFLGAMLYALLALDRARRASAGRGDADLAGFHRSLQIALLGYLASSLFLHGHFQRYLWLVLALVAAAIAVAHRPDPAPEPPALPDRTPSGQAAAGSVV